MVENDQSGVLMTVIKILISVLEANNIPVPEEAKSFINGPQTSTAVPAAAVGEKDKPATVSPTQAFVPKEIPKETVSWSKIVKGGKKGRLPQQPGAAQARTTRTQSLCLQQMDRQFLCTNIIRIFPWKVQGYAWYQSQTR